MSKESKLKKFIVIMREPHPCFKMIILARNKEEARLDAMKTGNTVVSVEEVIKG